jgi:argininosuccinate lyase
MPQKKNPDPLEVIKGKTGYVEGLLAALLSIGKNSFLGYNRDSQWTKYAVMDLVREVLPVPNILSELLPQLKVHAEIMEAWAHKGMLDATFIQEQLIQEFHIPMRQAKQLIEETVKLSLSADQLSLTDFKFVLAQHQLSINVTEKQWQQWHDLDFVFSQQSSLGGPGWLAQVESRKEMQQQLKTQQSWWQEKSDQIERAHHATHKAIESGISAL